MTKPSSMRLAYLVSQYPAVTHTFILRELCALRQLGWEIDVISIRPPDRAPEHLSEIERSELRHTFHVLSAGIVSMLAAHASTFCRRPWPYLKGAGYALRLSRGDPRKAASNLIYFAEAVAVGERLRRLGVGHVHSHFASTVALFLARVFPVTFSVTMHGPDEFNDVAGYYLPEKVAQARFICAISQYARSQLMKASEARYWSKLEVASLGVNCGVFTSRAHRENPRRIELLCVGRLAPAKAPRVLLAAVDRLVREKRSVHLRLVGDGPDRQELERMVAEKGLRENVTLEGSCNQEQVLAFYRETDLFVLASFAEGVPVVLMEAMAMEIPCIATWITGVPELIRHGMDGWLVPPGDEQQLAEAIAQLIDNPELRRRLGTSARQRVADRYDLARNVERLSEIYRRRLSIKEV